MGAWEDYRSCCRLLAEQDPGAGFCPECGHSLLRCPAPGCSTLVTPLGHCPRCLDLELSLGTSAVLTARVGECLSVPFVLRNDAPARSVAIKAVLRDATDLPQEPVPLAWEQLDSGHVRSFAVTTGPFAHAGRNALRLTIIAAAVFGDVEERYAFAGDVSIDVEGADPKQVVQTFNLSGNFANDSRVTVSPVAHIADFASMPAEPRQVHGDVALERAERYEIEQGCRGYGRLAARVPRNVEFAYVGFPANDSPPDGPLLQPSVIRCGRNGRAGRVPSNAEPNDLCLRMYDAVSGELDREASAGISRRACDFVLANDRLNVRAVSGAGVMLNDERVAAGEIRIVSNGDSVTIPAGRGRTLAIRAAFKVSAGLVTQVRLEKSSSDQ